jgi:ABC-type transporter Mla maintaining outer membrane lipid asymmetry permease subunit MlaE
MGLNDKFSLHQRKTVNKLLSGCFVLAFLLLWFYQSQHIPENKQKSSGRSLKIITKQSVFIVAMSSALVGYVIMIQPSPNKISATQ